MTERREPFDRIDESGGPSGEIRASVEDIHPIVSDGAQLIPFGSVGQFVELISRPLGIEAAGCDDEHFRIVLENVVPLGRFRALSGESIVITTSISLRAIVDSLFTPPAGTPGMPDLSVSETQLERLEEISAELEAVYVGEYGTVRSTDALQYLMDTYTPPEKAEGNEGDGGRSPADIEGLTAIDGVGEATAKSLVIAGFRSVDDIVKASPEALAGVKGIGREQAVDIVAAATELEGDSAATTGRDDGSETGEAAGNDGADEGSSSDADGSEPGRGERSPESTLQQAMSLLDAHDDRWRESSGDEPYEVDLPDGSTEAVRTKDDIKRLLFKHWR